MVSTIYTLFIIPNNITFNKNMKIVLLIIFIIVIVTIVFFFAKKKSQLINDKYFFAKKKRIELSKIYFKETYKSCNDVVFSSSHGLLMDASIVCNILKDIQIPSHFYYEIYDNKYPPEESYLFPNLDVTDFQALIKDEKSPHTIFCKTEQSYNIISSMFKNKNVVFTGFTSIDKYNPKIKKDYRKYIHIAGQSPWKGTISIVKAWLLNPQYPKLHLISRKNTKIYEELKELLNSSHNIKLYDEYLSDEQINNLINECGIHICASENEGFGHYIHEARSSKSVVLYTDAPPMNEFFINEYDGFGIDAEFIKIINDICPSYQININSLQKLLEKIFNMDEKSLEIIGENARTSFLNMDSKFKKILLNFFDR